MKTKGAKKMKKIVVFAMVFMMIISNISMVMAENSNSDIKDVNEVKALSEVELSGEIKYFSSIDYNGYTIRLFPETTLTKEEAIKKFNNAYTFIIKDFSERGINTNLDNENFQSAIKSYFLIEIDDKELQSEIREFASFMDFYENKTTNDQIINGAISKNLSVQELNQMLPAGEVVTKNNGLVVKEKTNVIKLSSYSGSTAATYATTWWNKTNNTSYPYYATYYGQSTSTNNLNDLPSGASGQSNPRRGWNDCTNFVSQAIYAGGISTIKTGLINPHSNVNNWYYSNSKPSHTWGGAHNFYQHFSSRAGVASSSGDLQVGDAVSVDFTGDGSIDHTIIITKTTGTTSDKQFVTYHTTDSNQSKTLKYFYDYNVNVKIYGYELDEI